MNGKFVVDRTKVGSAVVEQVILNVSGSSISEMRATVARHVASRHGVPYGPVLAGTRLAFLDGGSVSRN